MTALEPIVEIDPAATLVDPRKAPRRASRGRLIWMRLRGTPRFWIGAIVLGLMILWAIGGLWITKWSPNDQDLINANVGPMSQHFFGTNETGQDIYAQTVSGLRKSLVIGLIAGPLSTVLSAIIGSFAGYTGGKADAIISWITNLLLVVPAFFILILVSPYLKSASWIALIPFIAAFGWMIMAQVVRAQTKSLSSQDFVKAARFMGVGTWTILRRHIIPNLASLLIIDATLGVVVAVMTETALSYFGFGIHPPQFSLGLLLSDGTPGATTRPWVFLFPAGVLIVMLLAVSLIGDALRDAVDPRSGATRD
jgi:peptide/nickel transport system permease protein